MTIRPPRPNLLERRMTKFLRKPPSIRTAASVVVTATVITVVLGGVAMRVFDHTEYSSVWVAMWWAVQTVTTVGYGDVTPVHRIGRAIATFVMLEGIAFLAIVTAVVTSAFVARAEETRALEEAAAGGDQLESLSAQVAELTRRFDDFDALLRNIAAK